MFNTSLSKLKSKKKICKDVSVPITLIYYLQEKTDPENQLPPSHSTLLIRKVLLKNHTKSKYPMLKELDLTLKNLPLKERKHLYPSYLTPFNTLPTEQTEPKSYSLNILSNTILTLMMPLVLTLTLKPEPMLISLKPTSFGLLKIVLMMVILLVVLLKST